jgi:hypothetical protein
MSEAKNAFDHSTEMEEALRTVSAISKLLLRMGEDNEQDSIMFHFLGSRPARDGDQRWSPKSTADGWRGTGALLPNDGATFRT